MREHKGNPETLERLDAVIRQLHGVPRLLLDRPQLSLTVADYAPWEGEFVSPDAVVFSVCLSGGGRFRLGQADQHIEGKLQPGSMSVGLPKASHRIYLPRMTALGLYVPAERLDALLVEPVDWRAISSRLHQDRMVQLVLRDLGHRIKLDSYSDAYVDHCLGMITHRMHDHVKQQPVTSEGAVRALPPRLRSIIANRIEESLDEALSVEDLAHAAGISRHHFSRRFKRTFGVNPQNYIRSRRMERAKALLMDFDMTVLDVANAVGYSNPGHFSAAFRAHTGVTPREFRRSSPRS